MRRQRWVRRDKSSVKKVKRRMMMMKKWKSMMMKRAESRVRRSLFIASLVFTEPQEAPPPVPAQVQRPSARLMCTNLPQEVTDDMLAVLFQQCVLGPNCALSGSPMVTPPGTKASKQHKLPGLPHLATMVPGQKWPRFFLNHQSWRQSRKMRWTDSHSKKDGKCLLCTFEISLAFRYWLSLFLGTFAEMKHNLLGKTFFYTYFCKALRIAFPSGTADAGVWLELYISYSLLLSPATRLAANNSFSNLPPS